MREMPLPFAWWATPLLAGLLQVESGKAVPDPTPAEFANLPVLEIRHRPNVERAASAAFHPFGTENPSAERYRQRFEATYASAMELARETTEYDNEILRLVSMMMLHASRAEPDYRPPQVDGFGLRELLKRVVSPTCLPRSEETKHIVSIAQRIIAHWDGKNV